MAHGRGLPAATPGGCQLATEVCGTRRHQAAPHALRLPTYHWVSCRGTEGGGGGVRGEGDITDKHIMKHTQAHAACFSWVARQGVRGPFSWPEGVWRRRQWDPPPVFATAHGGSGRFDAWTKGNVHGVHCKPAHNQGHERPTGVEGRPHVHEGCSASLPTAPWQQVGAVNADTYRLIRDHEALWGLLHWPSPMQSR